MQVIVTDMCSVSLSVCLSRMHLMTPLRLVENWLHCVGSFGAAFAKLLWPLIHVELANFAMFDSKQETILFVFLLI